MLLTIFTATYNRAHLLPRLYDSLKRQQATDFEWIVVDDGSSDDTAEVLSQFIKNENPFSIRVFQQKHGGKHRAVNYGIREAKGKYFMLLDSDDYLTENAVTLITKWVETIENLPGMCGVAGTKIKDNGELIGEFYSGAPFIDATNLERRTYNLLGDKAEVYRTECLRRHMFPEFEGENYISPAYCWNAIAAEGLKIRWFGVPLQICEYLPDGITNSGVHSIEGKSRNFKGYCAVTQQDMAFKKKTESYRDFRVYQKVCKAKGLSLKECAEGLQWSTLHYTWYCTVMVPAIHVIKRVQNTLKK